MATTRALLLSAVGEEEFARQVKRWAKRFGWHGAHVRYSQGVVEGVHTLRVDGHSDAHGVLDWELVHEEPGHPVLRLELKSTTGRVRPDQQRWLEWYAHANGVVARVVRPTDEDELLRLLRGDG